MIDTDKEFQKAMSDLGIASNYLGDGQYDGIYGKTCYKLWQACQQLNDKRIADLLALVAKKDEALAYAANNVIAGRRKEIENALALNDDILELVELPIFFMGEPAYSIKQKSINKLSVNADKEQ